MDKHTQSLRDAPEWTYQKELVIACEGIELKGNNSRNDFQAEGSIIDQDLLRT